MTGTLFTGIYIMQKTMVRGGNGRWGKNKDIKKKIKKKKEKKNT